MTLKTTRDLERKWFCSRVCNSRHNFQPSKLLSGISEYSREKQAETLKRTLKQSGHPFSGKSHTEDTKEKISISQKRRLIENPDKIRRGELHPNWNGGKTLERGYVKVYAHGHPKQDKLGRVREHVLVAEKMLGRYLKRGEEVHHKDFDRSNNNPENLQVLSKSEHVKLHWKTNWRKVPCLITPASTDATGS